MAEFIVVVSFDGTGRLKIRANSEDEARADAVQMDPEDIDWDSHSIQVLHIEEGG